MVPLLITAYLYIAYTFGIQCCMYWQLKYTLTVAVKSMSDVRMILDTRKRHNPSSIKNSNRSYNLRQTHLLISFLIRLYEHERPVDAFEDFSGWIGFFYYGWYRQ